MTDTRINEIRAREAAATPGHWGTYHDGAGRYTIEARPRLVPGSGAVSVNNGTVAVLVGKPGNEQTYTNADFIARAREDVPYLLRRIAELEAAADRVRGLATRLEEFAENALRSGDRQLYAAIASDIRTHLSPDSAGAQKHAATLDTGARVVCPFCEAPQRINRDGRMRRHGDADRPCPGSGTAAAEERQS